MNIGTALFLLLILACPLMMVFMMRGHGGHGGAHQHHDPSTASVDELRRKRDELDREIATREDGNGYDGWRSSAAEREAQEKNDGQALSRR